MKLTQQLKQKKKMVQKGFTFFYGSDYFSSF